MVLAIEDQLQSSGRIASYLPAGDFTVVGDADFIGYVFFRELLLGFADEADLRDGVDSVRVEAWVRQDRVITECPGCRDPALLHRDRGE